MRGRTGERRCLWEGVRAWGGRLNRPALQRSSDTRPAL
ncbi:hypothetical protein X805_14160 [Sphaerotilus natans subsp. natans DSM 6575]|uniref:Uncharacterized protein n=1 Tax=Sphaerotilus natans subsp. natans DSM 6575 TaxID=1286631 RepID=A0A059KPE0_9BURK|nr:hypothetical protein X805_14160 [Sphaerotilus natans subsp. natans DSM 6575]